MSIPNKVNLFFVAILVPVLLLWSFSMLSVMGEINEINADQIEECYSLDCETTLLGGIKCEQTKMGDSKFQMEQPLLNITERHNSTK